MKGKRKSGLVPIVHSLHPHAMPRPWYPTMWFVHCLSCSVVLYGTIQTMHTENIDKLGLASGRGYVCGAKLNFGTIILSQTLKKVSTPGKDEINVAMTQNIATTMYIVHEAPSYTHTSIHTVCAIETVTLTKVKGHLYFFVIIKRI